MIAAAVSGSPTGSADDLAVAREDIRNGRSLPAAQRLQALVQAAPASHEARYWFHSALAAAGHPDASHALTEAVSVHAVQVMRGAGVDMARFGADPDYAFEIGQRFYAAKLPAVASVAFGRAIAIGEVTPQLLISYGLSLQHQGRAEEAVASFRAACELFPGPQVHQFLLFALFFAPDGVRRYALEARRWASLYAPGAPSTDLPRRPLAGRRLRLGYVAPSFTRSQIAQFILPVLAAHDRRAVEVVLYTADAAAEDPTPLAPWRVVQIGDLADEEAARRIRQDRLDVLVDLWGHTAGSRLPVFALRCAPVQAAWVNFVQTTGMSAIDYVLHSDSMEAPGTHELFTETVWRMGEITIPYRPASDRPEPRPTPALTSGCITFGSFNNPVKLSEPTVAAWARILQGRPGSRLLLKYAYFADPVLQRATQARFAAYGVEPERIHFRGHSTGPEYLREFADVDLALDPSPCPGGTTTCDALANGVPVLTLRGPDFYSRIGVQALECLPELIAESWEDYVARAVALTQDLHALDALRARVRPTFDASPMRDEAGFTRKLEAAFRQMVSGRRAKAA